MLVSGGRRRERGFLIWALFMETVLIVEDETATRDILVELLHKDGREIVTAGDGHEALERLTEIPRPCLIVLDLMMPGMNGFEFLRLFVAMVAEQPLECTAAKPARFEKL